MPPPAWLAVKIRNVSSNLHFDCLFQTELERLMTENADLKTGVKTPFGPGSRPGTPPLPRAGSGGGCGAQRAVTCILWRRRAPGICCETGNRAARMCLRLREICRASSRASPPHATSGVAAVEQHQGTLKPCNGLEAMQAGGHFPSDAHLLAWLAGLPRYVNPKP